MKISELMHREVVTVEPTTSLKDVASLLVEHRISGLPVCLPDGRVVGVVSEADIVIKAASHPERAGVFWRLFAPEGLDMRRLQATTAAEAMSAPAVTVDAGQSVAEAARIMVDEGVKRLPVVADGRLVGIVSRADIVRTFIRPDGEIWEELRNDVLARRLWIAPDELDVDVTGGRVRISGQVGTRSEAQLVDAFAWRVPGVVSVDCSQLRWETDDRAQRVSATR
jgi:CBS domain-containing protein